jgi:hypothetical protein
LNKGLIDMFYQLVMKGNTLETLHQIFIESKSADHSVAVIDAVIRRHPDQKPGDQHDVNKRQPGAGHTGHVRPAKDKRCGEHHVGQGCEVG